MNSPKRQSMRRLRCATVIAAIAAYNRAKGEKKLVTVKGIKHYGIYAEKRNEAQELAINWFREHLNAGG